MKKQAFAIAHIGLFSVLFYIIFLSAFRVQLVDHHFKTLESDYDLMEVSYDMVISLGERLQKLVDDEFDGNNVLLLEENDNSYQEYLTHHPEYKDYVFAGENVDLSKLSVNIFPYFLEFTKNLNSANKDEVLFYLNFNSIQLLLTSKPETSYHYNEDLIEHCMNFKNCSFFTDEKRVIVSKVYHDKITDDKVITLSYPVYGKDGDVVFDIAVDLRLPWLKTHDNAEMNVGGQLVLFVNGDPDLSEFTASKLLTLGSSQHFVIHYHIQEMLVDNLYILFAFFLLGVFFYKIYDIYSRQRLKSSKAEKDAIQDELTGLYNRRIFKHASFKTAIACGGSVIYIDINKFKPINDTFGHVVGDGVLKFVATHLRHQVRDTDFCVRFGGDEFVIVLPSCGGHKLALIMNNIIAINKTPYSSPVGAINVSVGSEEFDNFASFKDAMHVADERMYEHKKGDSPSSSEERKSTVIAINRSV